MHQLATASQSTQPRFVLTERLRHLLAAARERAREPEHVQRERWQGEAFFGRYAALPLAERQARSLADAMVRETARIHPGERLHGMTYYGDDPQLHGKGPWAEWSACPRAARREADENPEMLALHDPGGSFVISAGIFPGHVAWNYHEVLEVGIDGIVERHRQARLTSTDTGEIAYLDAAIVCLDGVLAWNRRHVDALRTLLAATDEPAEQQRLREGIALLEQVPAKPARTFHEALQSFYFVWQAVMFEVPYGGNSPGRLDYFLWPYLKPEYEAGNLSYQEATELVAELFLKIDERVHLRDGHVNTIVVGGVGPDGGDAVTPLSYMMLDAFEALPITHPAVYTRISERNPTDWWSRCATGLVTSGNRAQILADEAIIRAMMRDDAMPFTDAAMYICGGCMEINPHGLNSDLLFAFLYNVPKTVELLVTGGDCLVTRQPRLPVPLSLATAADFESFYAACVAEMRRVLHAKFRSLDIYGEELARWRPAFLQSSLTGDCLAQRRSLHDGGARYADYGGTPIGIQNAADALHAIRVAVFEHGWCTATELTDALRANFAGHEPLRRRLLAIPKFGAGDAAADAMMARLTADLCAIFDGYRNRHGGRVKPIVFTFVWAPEMGRSLGASADGRLAGEPIGHGLTPQARGVTNGLTTAIRSANSLPLHLVRGGASTMWDMDAAAATPARMEAVVRAFIRQGGQIFQGNTTSLADLEAALAQPDAFPDLIVRVGGFSARFAQLSPAVQHEIVHRHRHTA